MWHDSACSGRAWIDRARAVKVSVAVCVFDTAVQSGTFSVLSVALIWSTALRGFSEGIALFLRKTVCLTEEVKFYSKPCSHQYQVANTLEPRVITNTAQELSFP